jgi:hypothetical protein
MKAVRGMGSAIGEKGSEAAGLLEPISCERGISVRPGTVLAVCVRLAG